MASRDIHGVDFDEIQKAMSMISEGTNEYVEIIRNAKRAIDSINESNPGSEILLNKLVDNLQGCLAAVQECPQIIEDLTASLKKKSEEIESANAEARRKIDQMI